MSSNWIANVERKSPIPAIIASMNTRRIGIKVAVQAIPGPSET